MFELISAARLLDCSILHVRMNVLAHSRARVDVIVPLVLNLSALSCHALSCHARAHDPNTGTFGLAKSNKHCQAYARGITLGSCSDARERASGKGPRSFVGGQF